MVHHQRGLRRLLKNDDLLERIDADWRTAGLTDPRVAMPSYAEKLTLHPTEMTAADGEEVRQAGFSDRDILDICEVTSYFAYVNRIADGLGVSFETWINE